LIEKLADEFERKLNCKTEMVMLNTVNDLDTECIEKYRVLIKDIKYMIKSIAIKYNLQPRVLVRSRVVNARRAKMWEVLCDTKSKSMRGYGSFPEEYVDEFDFDIDSLLKLVHEL
jgi:hypothetical protein